MISLTTLTIAEDLNSCSFGELERPPVRPHTTWMKTEIQ